MKLNPEVYWKAANEHLWDCTKPYSHLSGPSYFSCDAIQDAGLALNPNASVASAEWVYATDFFPDCNRLFNAFADIEHGKKRQGARFMWLLFLYCDAGGEL